MKVAKYVVLNATFSATPIASGGKTAQTIGARRAQTEISMSQP
jgi:hypothetical protein